MRDGWRVVFLMLSFVFVFGLGIGAVETGGHPYRGGLSNRAARMVRGLDPGCWLGSKVGRLEVIR